MNERLSGFIFTLIGACAAWFAAWFTIFYGRSLRVQVTPILRFTVDPAMGGDYLKHDSSRFGIAVRNFGEQEITIVEYGFRIKGQLAPMPPPEQGFQKLLPRQGLTMEPRLRSDEWNQFLKTYYNLDKERGIMDVDRLYSRWQPYIRTNLCEVVFGSRGWLRRLKTVFRLAKYEFSDAIDEIMKDHAA